MNPMCCTCQHKKIKIFWFPGFSVGKGWPDLLVVGNETEVGASPNSGKRVRELNTKECEQLKKTFFGYAIYPFYNEFQNWLKNYYTITGPMKR